MTPPSLNDAGLENQVAIVTGGSRGIGRAIVETLAAAGCRVVFTYLANAAAAAEVTALDPERITAEAVDVRDAAACGTFVDRAVERAGQLDVLVNNAGVVRDNILGMLSDDEVRTVLDTNVHGAFNMVRAALPHLIPRRRGKILNISSVTGEKGGRGQTNYAASKGALNALTRSLAVELAPRGILVNAVAPGVIDTEMSRRVRERAGDQVTARILLRRVGTPQEVAHAVWFLASRYADYITGQILPVDGGFKME